MDRERSDADPDPNLYVYADQDPILSVHFNANWELPVCNKQRLRIGPL